MILSLYFLLDINWIFGEQFLCTFLEERPKKRKRPDEVLFLCSGLLIFDYFPYCLSFLFSSFWFWFARFLFFEQFHGLLFQDVKDVVKSGFIVDDAEDVMTDPKEESDEDEDLFDSVCAFCDNGGELLWYDCFLLHFYNSCLLCVNSYVVCCVLS